eukprot:4297675-Amphidinium_carterae.2
MTCPSVRLDVRLVAGLDSGPLLLLFVGMWSAQPGCSVLRIQSYSLTWAQKWCMPVEFVANSEVFIAAPQPVMLHCERV